MRCPICRQPVAAGSPDQPFCSDRCRIQDLANWATEKYVISDSVPYSDDLEVPEPPPGPDDPI